MTRDREIKLAAVAQGTFDPYLSAVEFDEVFGDRKSKAGADGFLGGAFTAIEFFEYLFQFSRSDSASGI